MSPPDNNERMAVMENELKHYKEDVSNLFKLVREHIQKDNEHIVKSDSDRQEMMKVIAAIRTENTKNKSFIGGVVFAATGMWAVITTAAYWFLQTRGH